jgi:protein-tyrosine phosphatase
MIRILVVCTGNVCRSPLAEHVLRHRLDELRPGMFEVGSAGIQALVAAPMDQRTKALLHTLGVESPGFAARQLEDSHLDSPDLVLAMTTGHRDSLVTMAPRLLKRTFTVRELARMLAALAADPAIRVPCGLAAPEVSERWRRLPQLASLKRYAVLATDPAADDVVDPYRQDDSVFEQMVRELIPALDRLVAFEAAAAAGAG